MILYIHPARESDFNGKTRKIWNIIMEANGHRDFFDSYSTKAKAVQDAKKYFPGIRRIFEKPQLIEV